jgi:DNA-3-methyladenine glycosylase II
MSKRGDTGFCISSGLGSSSAERGRFPADPAREGNDRSFIIAVRPPFRLDLTVWALRRRPINELDRWDGSVYRRAIHVGRIPVGLAVTQVGFDDTPRLRVRVSGACGRARVETAVRRELNHVLGLGIDLAGFYAVAAAEPPLDDLANRFRGMRPPRFPSVFEALVNGVACQQLSLQAGLTLLNRLVGAFSRSPGPPEEGGGKTFPQPQVLAGADTGLLQALGFSRAKSLAISEIAIAAAMGELEHETLANLDDAAACRRLVELRGVGRWTAEYVLLRGCGRLNIFPGDDVGARNNLQKWLRRKRPLNYESTKKLLQRWQPYAGLVYLHLLLKRIDDQAMMTTARNPPGCRM